MNQLATLQREMDGSLDFFKNDLATIRTNRASAALVDRAQVEAYGTIVPLTQTAAISVPDPRTITIQPWDRTLLKNIEQAIVALGSNLTPIVDKDIIRITLPPLNEESRRTLVKVINQKAEETKVAIRQIRDKIRSQIIEQQKSGDITEDEKFKLLKKIDEITGSYTTLVAETTATKEKEIMAI